MKTVTILVTVENEADHISAEEVADEIECSMIWLNDKGKLNFPMGKIETQVVDTSSLN